MIGAVCSGDLLLHAFPHGVFVTLRAGAALLNADFLSRCHCEPFEPTLGNHVAGSMGVLLREGGDIPLALRV